MLLTFLGITINAYSELENLFSDIFINENFSLNLNQIYILAIIKYSDKPIYLCNRVSRSTLQYNITKLVKTGMIKKVSDYYSDKRKVKFEITEKGEEILKKIKKTEDLYFQVLEQRIKNNPIFKKEEENA